MKRALTLAPLAAAAAALLLPLSAAAKTPAGTGLTASKTATGHLTNTTTWTIDKNADPASQNVAAGSSGTISWTITVTKSGKGTIGAYFDGGVCVTNTGGAPTQGLAITDAVSRPPSATVLNTVAVDVSGKPVLNPGQSWCYPYKTPIPSGAIVSGATYKDTAHVTITNFSGSPGTPTGPSPSATAALPTIPAQIDSSISVNDTNGQSFTFTGSGSQSYDQTVSCGSSQDGQIVTETNTATIQSTDQTAKATAKIHCGWASGDLDAFDQAAWGEPTFLSLLTANYDSVYASTFGVVEVGIPGTAGYSMRFSDPIKVLDYLPALGTPSALSADLSNPSTGTGAGGSLGGDVLALQLDVDFADAGFLPASSGLKFGDLTVCGLSSDTDLNGQTVRQVLATMNTALGGGAHTDSISDLDTIASDLTEAFYGGTPSSWALAHVAKDAGCTPVAWQAGDLDTLDQYAWGDPTTGSLLTSNFTSVYPFPATSGEVTVGIPGTPGCSLAFADPFQVVDFLPRLGTPDALCVDGKETNGAGAFAGDVLALQLDVDFADAGKLPDVASGLKFGDLIVCGLSSDTDLDGQTIRQVLATMNTALGGGTHTDSISDLDTIASDLTESFYGGTPSSFADDHLVNGSCP